VSVLVNNVEIKLVALVVYQAIYLVILALTPVRWDILLMVQILVVQFVKMAV
jgi:hypothetical protein